MQQPKKPITINFDKIIGEKLIQKTLREGTTVTSFVQHLVREAVMNDLAWFEALRKEAAMKLNECDYMIDRIKAKREMKE